jgi:hypothetical protein
MSKNEHAVALGRVGGQSRSPAKQAASRENGKRRKKTTVTFRIGDRVRKLSEEGMLCSGTVEYILPSLLGIRMDDGIRWSLSIAPTEVQP